MAFAVAAIVLGGFTLYNLSGASNESWALDPQVKFQKAMGNKHAKLNLPYIMSQHNPISDPRNHRATRTYHKRVKARVDSISPDPLKRKSGQKDVATYNYRVGSGSMAAPVRHMEARWG